MLLYNKICKKTKNAEQASHFITFPQLFKQEHSCKILYIKFLINNPLEFPEALYQYFNYGQREIRRVSTRQNLS